MIHRVRRWVMRILLIFAAVVVITALELFADFHPLPGIWWTHKQAMDYGGLALVALVIWLVLKPRSD
jgi:hypothetical protein